MGERRCYGRRTPEEGEPADLYISDEPIWLCSRCGGNECYPPMTVTERMASAAAGGLGVPKLSAEFRSKHGPPLDLGEKP